MIPYGRQTLNTDDISSVIRVLNSDFITQGPKIAEFENALAKYCGAKYAVAVSSGTAALHLAYLTAEIRMGDEVITTPNTFVATSNMIIAVGAKPIFCDIRLDTYNMDESKIESLITSNTKAVVPVHFAGHPCEMDIIHKIAKKYKLLVIEDACHALGAKYKDKMIGSISDMTVFSFHPVKAITTGEGGAILTNNKKYYDKLIQLRSHGIKKDKNGFNVMTVLGYNYRMTDIQASLGISQLKRLDGFINSRRQISDWYKEKLEDESNVILPQELPNNCSGWHIYIIRTKNRADRGKLMKYLKDKNIGANFHYPAVYKHPYYRKLGFNPILPNEEKYQSACITIPLFPTISRKDVNYISQTIKDFFK